MFGVQRGEGAAMLSYNSKYAPDNLHPGGRTRHIRNVHMIYTCTYTIAHARSVCIHI